MDGFRDGRICGAWGGLLEGLRSLSGSSSSPSSAAFPSLTAGAAPSINWATRSASARTPAKHRQGWTISFVCPSESLDFRKSFHFSVFDVAPPSLAVGLLNCSLRSHCWRTPSSSTTSLNCVRPRPRCERLLPAMAYERARPRTHTQQNRT